MAALNPPAVIANQGRYVLAVRLAEARALRIGALGRCRLEAGWYAYVGSGRRALRQRVDRHFASCEGRSERKHWHIDYVLASSAARIDYAVLLPGLEGTECDLNMAVGDLFGLHVPVPRFGASDCRAGCPAHFWYSPTPIDPSSLLQLGRDAVRYRSQ